MKKYKLYTKIVKKYRKMLMKQVKTSTPFDYDALNMFVTFLRFMLEYYVTKDNVHALEVEGHDRVEMISKALSEFDSWHNCDEDYYNEFEIKFGTATAEKNPNRKKEINELLMRYESIKTEHWNNFWNIIRDEFLYWWD